MHNSRGLPPVRWQTLGTKQWVCRVHYFVPSKRLFLTPSSTNFSCTPYPNTVSKTGLKIVVLRFKKSSYVLLKNQINAAAARPKIPPLRGYA